MSSKPDSDARDKLIKRMRALAAMTIANGCSEAEAAFASSKLDAMLAEHDIGLDEIQMQQSEFVKAQHALRDEVDQRLAPIRDAIATLTGTRAWINGVGGSIITFFGRDTDVMVAGFLFEIAQRALHDAVEKFDRQIALYTIVVRRRKRRAFIDGMATSMKKTIEKIDWTRKQQAGTGIVVVKHAVVDAEMKARGIELDDLRAGLVWDLDDSFNVGKEVGARVTFDAGITADQSTPLLLGRRRR